MVYDKANKKVSYYYAMKFAAEAQNSELKRIGFLYKALIL